MLCGWVLLLAGRHAEARAQFQSTLAFARQMPSATLHFQALMPLAWSLIETGEEEAGLACLREALAIGRSHDYKNCFPLWIPHVMSDPLAEPFHQGLIKNLHALGRSAEALQAYRRCRDILSITLGVEPSAATQALYRMIKG